MRIIIAGSRTATVQQVRFALGSCSWSGFATCIISGAAKGADQYGADWAREHQLAIREVPANWQKYGKRAGPVRNREMAAIADGLIAVWDGVTRGTSNMIETAEDAGLRIFVYRTDINWVRSVQATGELEGRWEFAEERAGMMEFSAGLERCEAERLAGLAALGTR